ncbi:MAG: hypothetical protein ACP5RJ_09015 [Conexivisphaera sp.]|nr:hypothetical protein [Conexivisphaerales archaeon]
MKKVVGWGWEAFRQMLEGLFEGSDIGRPSRGRSAHGEDDRAAGAVGPPGLRTRDWRRGCGGRLTFQNFLGYPEKVPYVRTIWLFRERIAASGAEGAFWEGVERNEWLRGWGWR